MNDPSMNNILRWGIENSEASQNGATPNQPKTQLDPKALEAFFTGGIKSEADQMKEAMATIEHQQATLDQKRVAFEDLEMLLGSIDNANNLEPLQLWTRLIAQLDHEEAELRKGAAWCAGTAVENNPRAQERLLVLGAIPTLVKLATQDEDTTVRKKAIRALSCASRNFQPGLDTVVNHVPSQFKPKDKLDAADMSSVDTLIDQLRASA